MKKILFIDGDEEMLKSVTLPLLLKHNSYDVIGVSSIGEALVYKEQEFDILLTERIGKKCFDVCEKINAKRKIIITSNENTYWEAKDKNLESYLTPINIGDLL